MNKFGFSSKRDFYFSRIMYANSVCLLIISKLYALLHCNYRNIPTLILKNIMENFLFEWLFVILQFYGFIAFYVKI